MHSTLKAALVAALAGLSTSTPVDLAAVPKTQFTVPQVKADNVTRAPPAISILQTYHKYAVKGASAPQVVITAAKVAAGSQTGSQSAVSGDPYGSEYVCPVIVGGKTLNLDFDTGSSDLWVFSTLLPSSMQTGHNIYNPNDGTSSLMSKQSWSISYQDLSGASGKVYADKVVVGKVTATAQAVEAATSASAGFVSDTSSDGLLGLAFDNINTVTPTQQKTFFSTVKSQLKSPLFTANLVKGGPGSYDFGYIDTSKYSGAITYVNVDQSNGLAFWQFNALGSYAVGSGARVYCSTSPVIVDTGTTLVFLPQAQVNAYYAKIKGATNSAAYGGWVYPCTATLVNMYIWLGGNSFLIPASYITYAPMGNNICFGGIQPNTGMGFSILGDIFIKSKFIIFENNGVQPRVGFAAKNPRIAN